MKNEYTIHALHGLLHQKSEVMLEIQRQYGTRNIGDLFRLQRIALQPTLTNPRPYFVVLCIEENNKKISLPIEAFIIEDPIMEDRDPLIEDE